MSAPGCNISQRCGLGYRPSLPIGLLSHSYVRMGWEIALRCEGGVSVRTAVALAQVHQVCSCGRCIAQRKQPWRHPLNAHLSRGCRGWIGTRWGGGEGGEGGVWAGSGTGLGYECGRLWVGGCTSVRRRGGHKVAKACQSPVGVGAGVRG